MKSKKLTARPSQWGNPVKAKLKKGQPVIGIVISGNNVEVAVQAANMGFDFIWMELEHSPIKPCATLCSPRADCRWCRLSGRR